MSHHKPFVTTLSLIGLIGLVLLFTADAAAHRHAIDAVDNPFIQFDKIIASDKEASSEFGAAVALTTDNQYLIVSAPLQDVDGKSAQGQVYVYQNDGQNRWSEQQILTASDGAAGDHFGRSLALAADNTLIVGAPDDDEGSDTNLGSAYIFTFNSGSWSEQQKLEATDAFAFSQDHRGAAVALTPDGSIAFVGTPGVGRENGTSPGAVYLFERSGETWSQTDTLVGPIGGAAGFGRGLAMSGDGTTLAIGGAYSDTPIIGNGRVYLYQQNGGTWSEAQSLTPSATEEFDEFGTAIALNHDGSVILIGASGSSPNKAYIFTESGGNWSEQQLLTRPSANNYGQFGAAVAVDSSGNYLAIGAWLNGSGGIHRYERSGGSWLYQQTVNTPDDRQEHLGFAVALSTNGEILAGGARSAHTDTETFDSVGAVYTYGEGNFAYMPTVIR